MVPLTATEVEPWTSPSEFGATGPVRTDLMSSGVPLWAPVAYGMRQTR